MINIQDHEVPLQYKATALGGIPLLHKTEMNLIQYVIQ